MVQTSKLQAKSRIGVIILVIIIILLLGGISYLYYQHKTTNLVTVELTDKTKNLSQVQLTGWQIYVNTSARFMFKYPSDWSIAKEYQRKISIKRVKNLLSYFINTAKAQSFMPPKGWQVIKEGYYVTPAGAKANTYTVILTPSGYQPLEDNINKASEPIIVINEQQFNCYGKEWWSEDKQHHIDLVFTNSPNFRWLPPYVKYTTVEGVERITGENYIATCSKDPKVLEILDSIAKSFKAIKPLGK